LNSTKKEEEEKYRLRTEMRKWKIFFSVERETERERKKEIWL